MKKTIDCEGSSNVSTIEYDTKTSVLTVGYLGGSLYTYDKVPGRKATELEGSVSKGKYIRAHIVPYYAAHRVN